MMKQTSANAFKKIAALLDTPEPAELGPGPRESILEQAALDHKIEELLGSAKLPTDRKQLIRALLLLWHDHLDAAHSIAQNIANAEGAFVHGILHRREPDYSNAAYWFRRVGQHPVFRKLADGSRALVQGPGEPQLADELIPAGEWNAFSFIDACQRANRPGANETERNLFRQIQAIETRLLLQYFCDEART